MANVPDRPPPEVWSKNFAEIVANAAASSSHPSCSARPAKGMHKGEIVGFFPEDLLSTYNAPFRFALVGKFSQGWPDMKEIHAFFKAQDFQDPYAVGLLNPRHILIRFSGKKDYHRCYSRMLWYVGEKEFSMRVFKWTPDFHADRESFLVPIWFKFPSLPVQFFNADALFFLASLFGTPLRLDSATSSLKRPSIARIQVEIDLLKELPSRLWIGTGESRGFWQHFEPDEALPSYCQYYWHVGHSETICTVKHPELKTVTTSAEAVNNSRKLKVPRQEYRPTGKQISLPQHFSQSEPSSGHAQPNDSATRNEVQKVSDLTRQDMTQPSAKSNPKDPMAQILHSEPRAAQVSDSQATGTASMGPSISSDICTAKMQSQHVPNPSHPSASTTPTFSQPPQVFEAPSEEVSVLPSIPTHPPVTTSLVHNSAYESASVANDRLDLVLFEPSSAIDPNDIHSDPETHLANEEDGWQTKHRRKPYQKRSYGRSNMETRSQISLRDVSNN